MKKMWQKYGCKYWKLNEKKVEFVEPVLSSSEEIRII